MVKQKTIKLKVADKQEAEDMQHNIIIAKFGVETAHRLHFEAGERLWVKLRALYPEIADTNARYGKGVITYTLKG